MLPWSKVRGCLINSTRRRFPILSWLPGYNLRKFLGDVLAGLAVGLMVVPQSLAIAAVAGLPPHYGLYSSFPGPLIYFFLGTCKDLNVGPTVICALVASRYNPYHSPKFASCVSFFSGIILTAAGFFNLGFVVRFISVPVFDAFIAAAAISISINQLQDLLGLPPGPLHAIQRLIHIVKNIKETRPGDAVLGITCFIALTSIGILAKCADRQRPHNQWPVLLKKMIKVLNIMKSALIVVLTTIISYLIFVYGNSTTFKIAGALPEGFPTVESPLRPVAINGNKTLTITDSLTSLGAGIGIVPLVVYIESIAVAKALAMRSQYEVDSSQELIAVGASNVFASFFNAFTITGSFARSAVNSISGAVTPVSGIVTAGIVILALQFITPVFKYIPITVLSAMVTATVIPMINPKVPKALWDNDRVELFPYMAAFGASFYELEFGIIVGTAVSLCVMLNKIMSPKLTIQELNAKIVVLKVNGPMWFPSSETFSKELQKILENTKSLNRSGPDNMEIQIDCLKSNDIDLGFAGNLKQKIVELEANGFKVVFINVANMKMKKMLKNIGMVVEDCVDVDSVECQKLIFETPV